MKPDKIIKLLNKNKDPYAMNYSKFKEHDYLTGAALLTFRDLLMKGRLFDYISKDSPGRLRMLCLQNLHQYDGYRNVFFDDVELSQLSFYTGEYSNLDDAKGSCSQSFHCRIEDRHRFAITHDEKNFHLAGATSNVKGLTHKCLTYVKSSMLIIQALHNEPIKLIAHCTGKIFNNLGKPMSQQQQVRYWESKGFKIDYYSKGCDLHQLSFAFDGIDVVADFLKSLSEEQRRFLITLMNDLRESSIET